MEEQDEIIKLSKLQHSNREHVKEIDLSPSSDTETLQDEAKANNVDVLDDNANSSVGKELETQDIGKNPLLDSEDQKDENSNMSGTLDVKPTNVGLKNISIGSIREKIKKQLELKKSAKDNDTEEELIKEAQKIKRIEEDKNPTGTKEDQKDRLVNFDQDTIEIKNNEEKPFIKSGQDNAGIKKDQEELLLELSPVKIDKDMRDECNPRLMTNKEVSSFLLSLPPKKLVTAEELVAISKAASSDKWIVYNSDDGDLAEWLNNNKPSAIKRSDGVGWIAAKKDQSIQERKNACQEELKEAWESVVANTDQINTNVVRKLAKQFGVTGGKWIFHVTTDRVDVVWGRVAMALHADQLGPNVIQAKVSPVFDTSEGEVTGMGAHVISVYNRDFTDEEQVLQVETSLRQANIRCMFQYKPEVYSILGIYRNNRWGLRPTIYHSQYHLKRGKSIIESAFENTWFQNETKGFGDDNKEMKRRESVSDKTGSQDATQSKGNQVTAFEKNEEFGVKGLTDPNKIEMAMKTELKVDKVNVTKNDKETNTTVKKPYKVIEDYLKDDYGKQKDESTIEEDPGLKLLKGLGIYLDKPEERIPLEMKDTTTDGRELEVEIKDDRYPQDMEELRSKVMSWLLTGNGPTEDTSCVTETTLDGPKNEALYNTSTDATGATYKKGIHGDTEDVSDHDDNNPMEKVCAANITPDKDVIDESGLAASAEKSGNKGTRIESIHELVSRKVDDNDADDESTPMKDGKKEKVDLKKPSWLRNLQNKVTKDR